MDFDVLMLTVDTWQLGWRPTDINLGNYVWVKIIYHSEFFFTGLLAFITLLARLGTNWENRIPFSCANMETR